MSKIRTKQFDRFAREICLDDIVIAPANAEIYRVDFGSYMWQDYEHTGFFLRNVYDNSVEPLGFTRTSLNIVTR